MLRSSDLEAPWKHICAKPVLIRAQVLPTFKWRSLIVGIVRNHSVKRLELLTLGRIVSVRPDSQHYLPNKGGGSDRRVPVLAMS